MWIDDGTADKVVRAKIAEARRRQTLAEKRLAGWDYQNDRAAPHFWLHLPPGVSATAFTRAALAAGVVVTPAEAFAAGGVDTPGAVRLSLSAPDTIEDVDTAVTRLAGILSARTEPPRPTV